MSNSKHIVDDRFDELKKAVETITKENRVGITAHNIIRAINKAEVIAAGMKSYHEKGVKVPKDLKRELAEKYYYPEKEIERMIYDFNPEQ